MADFAQILIRARDETKGAFDSAARNMRGLEAGAAKLRGLMGTIGIGAGLSVVGLAAFAKSGIDSADALNDMSQRLGVSVKDLASFKLAAEQSGTSLEGVGNGIARLTRSIGEAEGGNKKLAKALQDLGITARDPKEAFFQLADATERIADPAKRAALLSQVLGKSYQDLIPLLAQGGDELRKSALASASFADAMARLAPDADRFNDQLAALKINAAGLSGELLSSVVPALNEFLSRVGLVKNLLASGGIFNTVAITAGTSEISEVMRRLKEDIKATEEAIAGKKARGNDPSAFEEKLRDLNAQLLVMKQYSREAALALGEQFKNYKVPQTPGSPGKINAATSTAKTKAPDPLAHLLGSTDIGRTQEYNRLLGLLDARFAGGKKNAELYAQAVAKLNEQFGKTQIDVFDSGSFKTSSKEVADMIRGQQDAINGLNSEMAQDGVRAAQEYESALESLLGDTTLAKTEALQDSVDVLNRAFFDGVIGVEQYDQAIANLTEGADPKLEKTKSLAEDLGLTFSSAFEDAIVEGDKLSDVLKGLEQDIMRIITRKLVTEPLGDLITGMLEGFMGGGGGGGFGMGSDQNLLGSLASLFGFANGGIMTSAGPLPLSKYATGGIASTPQVALFGEGSMNEAFVPLPDGRRIPVAMEGGGGGVTVHMNISTPDANSFRASRGQVTAQYASALQRARRNM